MHFTAATIAVAGLAVHQAAAFGGHGGRGWGSKASYSTPDNTDNSCSSDQSGGYDWAGLDAGSFENYGSNKFSGWSCSNKFGKRDLLTKKSFQSKCITSNLDDEPSIGCNGDEKMSIDKYEVSSDQDADIECHYEMPDGSSCKEVHSCKSSGTVIQNSQCGGAKSVTFKPAKGSKGKKCNIGVHSVGFNCGTASSTAPTYSSTASVSSYSQPPAYTTSSSVSAAETTSSPTAPGYEGSSTASIPEYESTSTPLAPEYEPSSSSTYAIPGYANTTSIASYESSSSQGVPGYESSSTTTSEAPAATQPYPEPESPDVLPKCLNTWMYLTSCSGQSDYDCFCKSPEFMEKVYACISSWSDTDNDTDAGVGYLIGICAKYVPENPAIITACPSTVTPATGYTPPTSTPNSPVSSAPKGKTITQYSTIVATVTSCGAEVTDCPAETSTFAVATTYSTEEAPSSTEVSPVTTSPPASVPCTTITYSSSYVVPATGSASSYTTSIITTVTVPQVQITTYTVTESGSTQAVPGLGYAPPASSPSSPVAYTTAPAPAPYATTSVPGPVGPVGTAATLGTTYLPSASPSSSPITPYTGAGAKVGGSGFVGVAVVAIAGFFVL